MGVGVCRAHAIGGRPRGSRARARRRSPSPPSLVAAAAALQPVARRAVVVERLGRDHRHARDRHGLRLHRAGGELAGTPPAQRAMSARRAARRTRPRRGQRRRARVPGSGRPTAPARRGSRAGRTGRAGGEAPWPGLLAHVGVARALLARGALARGALALDLDRVLRRLGAHDRVADVRRCGRRSLSHWLADRMRRAARPSFALEPSSGRQPTWMWSAWSPIAKVGPPMSISEMIWVGCISSLEREEACGAWSR